MKLFVNILTLIRIMATIVLPFVWRFLNPFSIIIFVSLVLLTDTFDGLFARTFHVQTLFGSMMDKIADKVFGIVIILIIALYYPIYYLIAILELVICVVNIIAAFKGAAVSASLLGRAKMWVIGISTVLGIIVIFEQNLSNIVFLKPLLEFIVENKEVVVNSSVLITTGCEIMVIIDYVYHHVRELKNNKIEKYAFKSEKKLKFVLFDTKYFLSHKDTPLYQHLLK